MKTSLITLVVSTAMLLPLVANAAPGNFSSSGRFAYTSSYTYDGCSDRGYSLSVYDNSTKQSLNDKKSNPSADVYIYDYNYCTGIYSYSSGYATTGITMNKPDKKTITASGSIPVYDWSTGITDTVNFNATFTQVADTVQNHFGTTHDEYSLGGGAMVKVNRHEDYTSSTASVTGTLSSSVLNIDLGSNNGWSYMGNSRGHSVSISK